MKTKTFTKEHDKDNENARAKKVSESPDEYGNVGTQILDATVSPSNIRYPQDFSLTNEAREKLEGMIDTIHNTFHPWKKPRTYRKTARKEYLELAKSKRKSARKICAYLRRDLERIRRNMGYIEKYFQAGYNLSESDMAMYKTIQELYRQQKYMFDNKTHTVENRIVSLSQPYIRPVVRGKPKATKDEKQDEKDRIKVERFFSLDKRRNGAGLIMTKLSNTTLNTIALTVLVTNLFATSASTFFVLYFMDCINGLEQQHFIEIDPAA